MGKQFNIGDRVVKAGSKGPVGTVRNIRKEIIRESIKEKENSEPPSVTIVVLWDNGTTSHFVPDGLEASA